MSEFKIAIYCTSINELNLNGKPIKKSSDMIPLNLKTIDYIKIAELQFKTKWQPKTRKSFTRKSLQFKFNQELSEDEFVSFIKKMKESGYKTNRKKHQIVFIETTQNKEYKIKYSYDYVTVKTLCYPYKHTDKVNKWSYATKILYKK